MMKCRFQNYLVSLLIIMICTFYFDVHNIISERFRSYVAPPRLTIVETNGRLGNQMFLLATLYGLSSLNGRQLAMNQNNYDYLNDYFDLPFPVVKLSALKLRIPWKIGSWLSPDDRHIPVYANIIGGNVYPTSFTFFDHVRSNIQTLFKFRNIYRKHADNVFRHVKKVRPWTKVFVCVHVRRGDYLAKHSGGWLRAADGREVDQKYFEEALLIYRKKFQNITFLAVSDDRKWIKTHLSSLGILTLPKSPSPGHDLAVLASCNHTIMTYGTYGFWGGYLSGGLVVYFKDFIKPGSEMLERFKYEKMYPENWIGISTTPPGYWENYSNPFKD